MNPTSARELEPGGTTAAVRQHRSDDGARPRGPWSKARLSAAIAATRVERANPATGRPLRDEIEFFTALGTRHDVPTGAALVRRGHVMGDVHLVQRGAAAVLGDEGGRRPILALALRSELCGAIPALLPEPAPWDTVTVMDSSVVTVPAARFAAAVRERWADRWSARILSWLAEVGARVADLEGRDVNAQVAAVLLRHHGKMRVDLCRRTIADLLDLDVEAIRPVLAEFVRLGAVSLTDGHIFVARVEILRAALEAADGASLSQDTVSTPS